MAASCVAQNISLSTHPLAARGQVERLLRGELPSDQIDDVVLALHEALVNAARHAGGARAVEATIDHACLVVRVWDNGPGFPLGPYLQRPPEVMAERGRGLWLIDRLTSSCEVQRDRRGNVLIMRFERR
jgi:anti-sigma regulatory factor (Ser/Thr protein kinase)